jgi:hypothetical protein
LHNIGIFKQLAGLSLSDLCDFERDPLSIGQIANIEAIGYIAKHGTENGWE